jgi:hypothetical protein
MNLQNQQLVVRQRHSRLAAPTFQNNFSSDETFHLTNKSFHDVTLSGEPVLQVVSMF